MDRITASTLVLVVDDEARVREPIVRWLKAAGHDVTAAGSADEAIALLERAPAAVAICDVRLPGKDRHWLAAAIAARWPETAIIAAAGVQDFGAPAARPDANVIDHLLKPFGRDRVKEAVRRGLDWHQRAIARRTVIARFEEEGAGRRDQLAKALHLLTIDSPAALDSMLIMLTISEPSLPEHGRRVATLAGTVGAHLGVPPGDIEILERAALVHDLPKLIYPEAIARKEGTLLCDELAIVRRAPEQVCDLLARVPYLAPAGAVVRARFERWDGTGYPRGLRGEEIPLLSRLLALADTYDTLLLPRRYRPALDEAGARAEILACAGSQFDPALAVALERAVTSALAASSTGPSSSLE